MGHIETMQALVAGGAQLNVLDRDGASVLMLAARHDRVAVMEHLVQHSKLSIREKDFLGRTVLMHAASGGAALAVGVVLNWMAEVKMNPNEVDSKGYTALEHACTGGNLDVMQVRTGGVGWLQSWLLNIYHAVLLHCCCCDRVVICVNSSR